MAGEMIEKMNKLFKFLRVWEEVFYATTVTTMIIVFMIAFFNNNQVLVMTNNYGEAKLEFILIIISILIITFNTFIKFSYIRKERKANAEEE